MAAVDDALDLAARHDAEVDVLYVVDSRRYDTSIESAVEPLVWTVVPMCR